MIVFHYLRNGTFNTYNNKRYCCGTSSFITILNTTYLFFKFSDFIILNNIINPKLIRKYL